MLWQESTPSQLVASHTLSQLVASSSQLLAAARTMLASTLRAARTTLTKRLATTQAVVLEEVGKLSLRDIDVSEPFTADDVRIDIKSVGICGSDVHYYKHGVIGPFVVNQPMILGHEASGVVAEVGANVTHLEVGDRVCICLLYTSPSPRD